jgi:hypothetical protein
MEGTQRVPGSRLLLCFVVFFCGVLGCAVRCGVLTTKEPRGRLLINPCMQGLKLFLDYSGTTGRRKAVATPRGAMAVGMSSRDAWAAAYSGVAAGAALVTGIGVMAYLRRSA